MATYKISPAGDGSGGSTWAEVLQAAYDAKSIELRMLHPDDIRASKYFQAGKYKKIRVPDVEAGNFDPIKAIKTLSKFIVSSEKTYEIRSSSKKEIHRKPGT
jgi:hypothetical protein